jgi:hypothetical protein
MVEFDGLEAAGKIATQPSEIRRSYLREVEGFCQRVREGCERNNCHYLMLRTDHKLSEALSGYLAFRRRTS